MSTWEKLSKIDCSQHVEQKGGLSYLSWAWAWGTLMENYPDSSYEFTPPIYLDNRTVEVQVTVIVNGVARTMWLPVMDYKNKSLVDPTTRDISDARMRCLVKCIAMFGLGHYIYAGEDLPQIEPFTAGQRTEFMGLLMNNDGWGLKRFAADCGLEVITALFNSFGKGEISKNKQLYRDLVGAANNDMKNTLAYIREALVNGTLDTIEEALAERDDNQRLLIWAALTEIEKAQIEQLRSAV